LIKFIPEEVFPPQVCYTNTQSAFCVLSLARLLSKSILRPLGCSPKAFCILYLAWMALVTAVDFFDRLDLHHLERMRIWMTTYAYEGLHYVSSQD